MREQPLPDLTPLGKCNQLILLLPKLLKTENNTNNNNVYFHIYIFLLKIRFIPSWKNKGWDSQSPPKLKCLRQSIYIE